MNPHLVQMTDGTRNQVAVVDEPYLRVLPDVSSTCELVRRCLDASRSVEDTVLSSPVGESISYDEVYSGRSAWRLMAPIHVPDSPSQTLISGTGLTHLGSARQRDAMHVADRINGPDEAMTD